MNQTKLITAALALTVNAAAVSAQSFNFDADDLCDRGYTDRPYLRYEAEPGICRGAGPFEYITADPYNQESLASEASNGVAARFGGESSSLSWRLDAPANALTIRFSLPDSPDGKGTRRVLTILNGNEPVCDVTLDSYWAWQYTVRNNVSEKYPDNTPSADKFARMRFDEVSVLLPVTLPEGAELCLECHDGGDSSVTIDFVEAELAPSPVDAPEGAAVFTGTDGSKLQQFINANAGKTIFIPAGTYEIPTGLEIKNDDTRIVGAGMWHTTLMFTASPDNPRTYGRRGVTCSRDRCSLEGLTLNTLNNRRYYDNNPSMQTGKALMGSWGKDSYIKNIRADHFECGAWIADYGGNPTERLTVTHCRFRNNYADGINLCSGTTASTVSHCSFRNNGDDDMASWSVSHQTSGNLFDHNTAENNWRASSLGFFGGRANRATNIVIADAMEAGARVTADFEGTGFADDGSEFVLENISIRRCGIRQGSVGTYGDFWGNAQASLMISAGYHYDVVNTTLRNIDIYDTRGEALRVRASNSKKVRGLNIEGLHIHGVPDEFVAINFAAGLKGDGRGSDITADGCLTPFMTDIPSGFIFDYNPDSLDGIPADGAGEPIDATVSGNSLTLNAAPGGCAAVYNSAGALLGRLSEGATLAGLPAGVCIVSSQSSTLKLSIK